MDKVADSLRGYVDGMHEAGVLSDMDYDILVDIADQIDHEHERRMEQQSYDLRKAFCRYMGEVVDDYRKGMKRKRMRK